MMIYLWRLIDDENVNKSRATAMNADVRAWDDRQIATSCEWSACLPAHHDTR